MDDVIEERKNKLIEKLNLKKNWYWFIFVIVAWLGYWIRTRNLSLLIDVTSGKYIPVALDPYAFLRYAKHILENGSLMAIDYMRYYPWGYDNLVEFKLLSFFIVYLFKFFHFFNSSITLEKVHVLYPPIAFVVGLIFFFLLVKKLFDYRVALLSSLLLGIIPPYLHRTLSGFSDKEALAMVFFFAVLYFFVTSWQSKNWKSILIFGGLSGFITGLMGLVWGGMFFVVVILAIFALVSLFFIRFRVYHLLTYASWLVLFFISFTTLKDFVTIKTLIVGIYSSFSLFVLLAGVVYYILFEKDILKIKSKLENKIPLGILTLAISGVLGLIGLIIIAGFDFVINTFKELTFIFTSPFGQSRWALTVAESRQPYFRDWIGQMSWKYIWVLLIGSVWLFYDTIKKFLVKRDGKIIATLLYSFLLIGWMFNRYAPDSSFNGTSNMASQLFLGSTLIFGIFFIGYYLYIFKKDQEAFIGRRKISESGLLVLVWFFVMILAARSASRLFFVLAPITTILFSYLIFRLFDFSLNKKDVYKIGAWILMFFLLINPFSISSGFAYGLFDDGVVNNFYERTVAQARHSGPSYSQQWQIAGGWVRENTPEDAVFAHWWDYGYWVQTGFERATVTDGGNAKSSLNHLMGRYFLTGENEIEALKFFKAHDVTHALMISDEIGKYPAFSSIGADRNWDRYSWINVFTRDDSQTQENRDGTLLVFAGGTAIDWDLEYKGKLYPKGGGAGIAAILLPIVIGEDGSSTFSQPRAVLTYNGEQETIPLECLYLNGQEMTFPEEGLKGCFFMVPRFDGGEGRGLVNGFYISEKVKNTLFYKLYLTEQETEYFKLVYTDQENLPLSIFNGRTVGPLKIWEISYPEDLEVPERYYGDKLADLGVTSIEGRY